MFLNSYFHNNCISCSEKENLINICTKNKQNGNNYIKPCNDI